MEDFKEKIPMIIAVIIVIALAVGENRRTFWIRWYEISIHINSL